MALEDVLKNSMLAVIDTDVTHLGLHTAFPATSGNEIAGGAPAYARQVVGFDAPSGGAIAMTGTEVFDVENGDTVSAIGLWDALTVGTIQGGADVTDEVFGAQGTYTVTALTITLT